MADETTKTQETKPRVSRAIKVLLFASLALNLLVVSAVVGIVANGGPRDRDNGRAQSHAAPFVRALEREDRRAIGKQIRRSLQRQAGSANLRDQRRQSATAVLELLRADAFDAAQFLVLMEQQGELAKVSAHAGAEAMAQHLSGMAPEARRDYADRVEELLAKGPKRFGPKNP